ncbi:MAG: hypothetical protein Q9191_000141 [Dirinaria sp. TL-2023a]
MDQLSPSNNYMHSVFTLLKGSAMYITPASIAIAVILPFVWFSLTEMFPSKGNTLVDAPIVGPNWSLFARYKFFKDASTYVQEGYRKFGDKLFKLSGHDILILPNKYVDELRNLPEDRLSSIQANIDNFQGLYSTTNILLEGHLHTHVIQTKLTPKLAHLVTGTQAELKRALNSELSGTQTEDFAPFGAFHLILRLVSHIAARHFVGPRLCRDEDWLSTALIYTENAFRTIILLRLFPNIAKPVAAWFIPYSWRVSRALKRAQDIIIPEIHARRKAAATGYVGMERPNDFLQWMMDEANEYDGAPHRLAHRLLILTLAAVHTTSMAATQTLFDVSSRPEYIQPLREEVIEMTSENAQFTKTSLTKMRKLDSFMRESQRLNPPSLLGFKRHVKQPLTLGDGVCLPKDVHLMMPIYPIVVDAQVTPDPFQFQGFRHHENRLQPGEGNRHQFATTSKNNMHFGHGKYACPGRFFAANTVKMVIAQLLLDFDLKLADGETRPDNVCLHEYVFPNPEAKLLFRRRQ